MIQPLATFHGVLVTFWIFFALMIFRTLLISKYRMRILDLISERANGDINRGKADWERYYKKYEKWGSFNSMIYDMFRWKYKSFYGEFFDEEEVTND